jgi:hypothetical protein
VESQHPFSRLSLFERDSKLVSHVNAPDDQDLSVLLDLTLRLRVKISFPSGYPARFQRATKGARQSTCRGSHQVVQGSGVRLVDRHVRAVMFGDFIMHAEGHRPGFGW